MRGACFLLLICYVGAFPDNSQSTTNETTMATVSTEMPVLSTATPYGSSPRTSQEPRTTDIADEEQLQAEEDDQDGEELPTEMINAGVSPRPVPPLSSADLEEKLRRLTETMEKIQRGDDFDHDAKAKSQTAAWQPKIFEQSGNRPPWDQSDDEDEQMQGSGSGETDVSPTMDDKDALGGAVKVTHSSDQQWTTAGRSPPDGSQRKPADITTPKTGGTDSSYSATGTRRFVATFLCTVAIYRWFVLS